MNHKDISPLAIFSLLLMLFLAAIDTTILTAAMPEIVRLLGQPELYHWGFTAFMLCSTLALPFFGKLADQIGVRSCMLAAGGIFLIGSALCTVAESMALLIAGRAVQGLGAAGLQGLPLIAFGVIYPPEQRGAKQGLISIVWGFSSLAGPSVGGFLVAWFSWRWIFGLNVLIGLLALALFWRTFPATEAPPARQQLDGPSTGLLLTGLSSLILLSSFSLNALSSLGYLLCFGVLGLFVWRQGQISNPLVPLQHFASPVYRLAVLLGFTAFFVGFAALTFIPLYLQEVLAYTPRQTGLILTPMMLTWPISSALAGRWLNQLGFRTWALLGTASLFSSMLAWGMIGHGWLSPASLLLWCIMMGLGMGCLTPIVLVAAQSIAPRHEIGVASSTLVLLRSIGTTLGVSLMGALQVSAQLSLGLQHALGWVFSCLAVFALLNLISSTQLPDCAPAALERL